MNRTISYIPSAVLSTCRRSILSKPAPLSQCLHTTPARSATPLPITATGPPPPAPMPAVSQHGERADRRRRQAELLKRGQDMRASHMKPGTAMKKRFWKDVVVQTDNGMLLFLEFRQYSNIRRSSSLTISSNLQKAATQSTSTVVLFAILQPKRPSRFPRQNHILQQPSP